VRVDIETAVQRGTLTQVALSSQTETDLFLSLVGDGLHDGEAASAAVAASKGFSLLTDEAPARRVMAARKYEHLLLTSADVLKVWVATVGVDADTLREIVRRIEHRASVGCLMRSGRFSARPTVARPAQGMRRNSFLVGLVYLPDQVVVSEILWMNIKGVSRLGIPTRRSVTLRLAPLVGVGLPKQGDTL
jgi:hypothetical protein